MDKRNFYWLATLEALRRSVHYRIQGNEERAEAYEEKAKEFSNRLEREA